MEKMRFLTGVALLIGLVSTVSWAQSDKKPRDILLTAEEQKAELARLREIFASVDKMPARGARWIEVQTGPADQKTWQKGWLIQESDADIQVLTEHGWKETFDKKKLAAKKPPAEFKWSDAWAIRDGDFAKHCREFLVEKKKDAKDDPDEIGVYRFQRERMEADAAVINAARLACWTSATGNDDLAGQLLQQAQKKFQERRDRYIGLPTSDHLHVFVAGNTYPHSEVSLDTLLDRRKEDPRETRCRSLDRKRALAKIPYREDHDAIMREIKALERLVAEDKDWKEPTKEEFAKLDVKQKAAYWLHHLRDLNVTQSMSPGMCLVLTDSPFAFSQDLAEKGSPNPAVELKNLGYEALPLIIAHLDDERPTRCVGFWRHYAPDSYYTLTYGDCCQQIFEGIALYSVYERATTSGYPIRDGQGKQCKERAEQWWQDFEKKGEKQILIEGTRRGDRDSYRNAERLVKKYPEAAFDPLQAGIKAAKEDWIRSNLLNYMRDVKDDRAIPLLRQETKGPHLKTRVNALEGLLERGQAEAVPLLIAEWRNLDPEKGEPSPFDGTERLQTALVRCGDEKALAALAASWNKLPVEWRHRGVAALREAHKDFAQKPFTPTFNTAVEALLISCLGDRDEGYRLRRTCDLAADALAARWGDPKRFDLSAPLSIRNRRILEVHNVWRKKQGLNPLPLPEPRKVAAVAATEVAPLLKTLLEAPTPEARSDASAAVERLGLGALPHVTRELASLPKAQTAREPLSKLAGRLACIVEDVRFSETSVARPEAMREAAAKLKNRPLSEKAFVELILALHKHVPAESGGIVVALDRDGDDTGIQLEIRVLPRRDPEAGGAVHLRRREEVIVDGQELRNSTSASAGIGKETDTEWDSADWKGLVSSLSKALEAPPEKPFQVRAEVTRGR